MSGEWSAVSDSSSLVPSPCSVLSSWWSTLIHQAHGALAVSSCLAGALLGAPAPVQFSVLAAPVTSGHDAIGYTLADVVCAPPQTAPHFSERLVLLPAGAYPFSHASWVSVAGAAGGGPDLPTRVEAQLPEGGLVVASFVQRWKLNPTVWSCWCNVLRRQPHASLWLLQHSLDGANLALSTLLRRELRGLSSRRLSIMRRQPLERHVHRTGVPTTSGEEGRRETRGAVRRACGAASRGFRWCPGAWRDGHGA